jgi:hypothetical protein
VTSLYRPEEEEQPTPRQLEMLLEESSSCSSAASPDSSTVQATATTIATTFAAVDELAQLEQLEREMEAVGGAPLVRRSVSQAERQRLEQAMAELARLEAEILQTRSVRWRGGGRRQDLLYTDWLAEDPHCG